MGVQYSTVQYSTCKKANYYIILKKMMIRPFFCVRVRVRECMLFKDDIIYVCIS
jgi:hypothetical protein